jgi:hypothetical protein
MSVNPVSFLKLVNTLCRKRKKKVIYRTIHRNATDPALRPLFHDINIE